MTTPEENKNRQYSRKRVSTEAYEAKEEFMEILNADESFSYKPWQFADSDVCADTLKTTYDEISIWGLHEAMLRPGFKIGENVVHVPNIFAKVNGVQKDTDDYMDKVNALMQSQNTLFFKKLPMTRQQKVKHISRTYRSVLNDKGDIDRDRLMSSEYWRYKGLKPATQKAIANRIIAMCTIPEFWKFKSFRTKLHLGLFDKIKDYFLFLNNISAKDLHYMKLSTFQVLMNLDNKFVNLLHSFDYPMAIPKIIIYNNGNDEDFTFSDAVILMFMNSMGVDVMIFNPSGKSDIENYVKESFYDSHTLDQTGNRVPFKKSGIFKGIF